MSRQVLFPVEDGSAWDELKAMPMWSNPQLPGWKSIGTISEAPAFTSLPRSFGEEPIRTDLGGSFSFGFTQFEDSVYPQRFVVGWDHAEYVPTKRVVNKASTGLRDPKPYKDPLAFTLKRIQELREELTQCYL